MTLSSAPYWAKRSMRSESATSLARLPTQRLFDGVSDSSESPPILPGLVFIIIDLLFGGGICGSNWKLGFHQRERERACLALERGRERFDFGEWSREEKREVDESEKRGG